MSGSSPVMLHNTFLLFSGYEKGQDGPRIHKSEISLARIEPAPSYSEMLSGFCQQKNLGNTMLHVDNLRGDGIF